MEISVESIMRQYKICDIIRYLPIEKTIDYVNVLYDCGIRMTEVATKSDNAYEQIRPLRKHVKTSTLLFQKNLTLLKTKEIALELQVITQAYY